MATDEPFGRQPKPVNVSLSGEAVDIMRWMTILTKVAESQGDNVQRSNAGNSFTIYPRAVND